MGAITDPALLAQLETPQSAINRGGLPGGPVRGGGSATTQKRYNDIVTKGEVARDQFGNLVRAYGLTQSTPTGYLQSMASGIRRNLGAGDGTVQDREQMQALQDQMVMSLPKNGDAQISDSERASFRGSLFSPSYQPEANRGIIDAQIKGTLGQLARARLASQWKAKHGSLDAVDTSGRTYDDAVNDFFASSAGQQALRPFSQRIAEQQARRLPGAAPTGNGQWKVVR